MTKEEQKAIELVERFYNKIDKSYTYYILSDKEEAKQCALICVDEILKEIPQYKGELNPRWKFWQTVKEKIKEL